MFCDKVRNKNNLVINNLKRLTLGVILTVLIVPLQYSFMTVYLRRTFETDRVRKASVKGTT